MSATFHAVLSPSSSSRWLNCPGSVSANAGAPRTTNAYAEEGTAAHALLELCLRLSAHPDELEGVNIYEDYHVDEDMMNAVAHAYDYIKAWKAGHEGGEVYIEHRVHWGAHPHLNLPEEQSSGTADVILHHNRSLVTIDYKHGAGKVVEVGGNTQTMLYSLGAMVEFETETQDITMCIIRPRARHDEGPVRVEKVSRGRLTKWAKDVVAPAARAALTKNAKRCAGGWCQWCSAAPTCRELVDHVMTAAGAEFADLPVVNTSDPHSLSHTELAKAMAATAMIEAWAHAVRGRVLALLTAGNELDGWKLVLGRTTRSWSEEKIKAIVGTCHKLELPPNEYAPRILASPAAMEKIWRKHKLKPPFDKALAKYIVRSQPGVHVAPEHDPRPTYLPGSEFTPIDEE